MSELPVSNQAVCDLSNKMRLIEAHWELIMIVLCCIPIDYNMKMFSIFFTFNRYSNGLINHNSPLKNCHSVILMGAGLPAEDLGFESPLCQKPTHKVARRQNVVAVPGPCGGGLWGNYFPGKLVEASLYAVLSWACVQYRWRCLPWGESTPRETPGVGIGNTPITPRHKKIT